MKVPTDLVARVAALGRVINAEGTAAIYAPLHEAKSPPGMNVVRDIKYASDERNLLDVFHTSSNAVSQPVLVFVHGGGFVAGNKQTPNTPFYESVGAWAAKNGLVGVTMTYRLAPDHKWPSGAEDVGKAIGWVRQNIAKFGGDPSQIVLFGHSAGASHVAAYAAMPELWARGEIGLAATILSSGVYDFETFPTAENIVAYVGADASRYAARSSQSNLASLSIPSMIVYGEFDPPQFVQQAQTLAASMSHAPGDPPRALNMRGHNHLSLTYSIGTEDQTFSAEILKFIESTVRKKLETS